jgi:hypothetical protein
MTLIGAPGRDRGGDPETTASQLDAGQSRVAGNARLTALASATLLVLFVIEFVTVPMLSALLTAHIVVGVLLIGPLVAKLASIGSRFMRYYAGSPAFVAQGPPRLALRVLAPLLLTATLLLVGSGLGLLVTGPAHAGPFRAMHALSFLSWLLLVAIHATAYIRRVPRLIAADWGNPAAPPVTGRRWRLGLVLGALLISAVGAVLLLPLAAPWLPRSPATQEVPGPFIAGTLVTILALLAIRPLRWG